MRTVDGVVIYSKDSSSEIMSWPWV